MGLKGTVGRYDPFHQGLGSVRESVWNDLRAYISNQYRFFGASNDKFHLGLGSIDRTGHNISGEPERLVADLSLQRMLFIHSDVVGFAFLKSYKTQPGKRCDNYDTAQYEFQSTRHISLFRLGVYHSR